MPLINNMLEFEHAKSVIESRFLRLRAPRERLDLIVKVDTGGLADSCSHRQLERSYDPRFFKPIFITVEDFLKACDEYERRVFDSIVVDIKGIEIERLYRGETRATFILNESMHATCEYNHEKYFCMVTVNQDRTNLHLLRGLLIFRLLRGIIEKHGAEQATLKDGDRTLSINHNVYPDEILTFMYGDRVQRVINDDIEYFNNNGA